MKERREKILADPEAHRREQIERRVPDDFEELTEEEQQRILEELENEVLSVDPAVLRDEIGRLSSLVELAKGLEAREIETKLVTLRSLLMSEGIFNDPTMKLLIFTEHKDTLDYLAADGKDGRPLGKLRDWGLTLTQIHGSMKIGDRDTPGSRIYAEREFREACQVLVATEAAGEGINLQFCWLLINFDIPWNPVRLEQRIGRIHRYGQEKDCLVFNFVAHNTREGRVLAKLHERLREIRNELGTDQVFDVVGDVFPANELEKLLRKMYARQTDEHQIQRRIVEDISPDRFRAITESALEGLGKRELNLSAIIGKSVEAKERRLVPEVVEQFFTAAGPDVGLQPKPVARDSRVYRIGKVPRHLFPIGDRQEQRFGRMGREYGNVCFDKAELRNDPTLEWITPGHPLFEVVRSESQRIAHPHLRRGAIYYDLHRTEPALIDIFAASVKDGRGATLHRRLFVIETTASGTMRLHEPTMLHEISPAETGSRPPTGFAAVPSRHDVEQYLYGQVLVQWLERSTQERLGEVRRIAEHVEISLNALINKQNFQLAELLNRQVEGQTVTGLDGLIAQSEQHVDGLNNRLESRRRELELEKHCTIADITHLGRAWIVPHPQRETPQLAPMVRDDEIERIAVNFVIQHEQARGWQVESVESENRGFDLISRRSHPEDPKTFVEVRFIEVKGRAGVGVVALSENEYRTAERLKTDYWLYVVFNCAGTPQLHDVQDPVRLGWQTVMTVEHYRIDSTSVIAAVHTT